VTDFNLSSEVRDATSKRMADHKASCDLAKQLKERGIVVRTNFQYFGWVAVDDNTYDGPGSPLGQGRTEAEAIEDLVEQLDERDERIQRARGERE
jgi:hypothetical protein